jgi:hypothetical protein
MRQMVVHVDPQSNSSTALAPPGDTLSPPDAPSCLQYCLYTNATPGTSKPNQQREPPRRPLLEQVRHTLISRRTCPPGPG